MSDVVEKLSPECREWLADQCSGDMKLADAVAAIVTDAYNEELDAEQKAA